MGIPNSIARDSLEYFHANVELLNIKTAMPLISKFAGVQQETSLTSALMIAARRGFTYIIPLLKEKELRMQDVMGQTALHKALMYKQEAAAILLCEEKDINDVGGATCLMFAAMSGSLAMVTEFFDQIQAKDRQGRTALMKAAIYNHPACVERLVVEAGEVDSYGLTACALAAQRGYWNIVGLLYSAEGGIPDSQGNDLKAIALNMEYYEVVAYIEDGVYICKRLPSGVKKRAKEMRKYAEKQRLLKEEQQFQEEQAKQNLINSPRALSEQIETKLQSFQRNSQQPQAAEMSLSEKTPTNVQALYPVKVTASLLPKMGTASISVEQDAPAAVSDSAHAASERQESAK